MFEQRYYGEGQSSAPQQRAPSRGQKSHCSLCSPCSLCSCCCGAFSPCNCCCGVILFVALGWAICNYIGYNPMHSGTDKTTDLVTLSYQTHGDLRCLDVEDKDDPKGAHLRVVSCDPSAASESQRWSFSNNRLMHATASGTQFCVDIPEDSSSKHLRLWSCTVVVGPHQAFKYTNDRVMTKDGKNCLEVAEDGMTVLLSDCDSSHTWSKTAVASSMFLSRSNEVFRNVTKAVAETV